MAAVSVIVPVYNVEKYLPRCLDSVLAQTSSDFEVICVNDGSTDGSLAILREYAAQDKRISIIDQPNGGLSNARNVGMAAASGRFVYFLDSDDAIHPRLLEICIDIADEETADIVQFGFIQVRGNPPPFVPLPARVPFRVLDDPLDSLAIKGYGACLKMFSRELLDGVKFMPNIFFEDVLFACQLLVKKPKVVHVDQILYHYTVNMKSITRRKCTTKYLRDYFTVLSTIAVLYESKGGAGSVEKMKRILFPDIIKAQLNRIRRMPRKKRRALFAEFLPQLFYWRRRGYLDFKYHKARKWLWYYWLMRRHPQFDRDYGESPSA